MTQLKDFIAHARKKGMDHSTIRMLLLSAGWKEKDIAEAVTEESLDMPIPLPTDGGGARDAFFHLLTFVSLYTTVISTIILFFTYINHLFPDAALEQYPTDTTWMGSTIRWSIAAIIVSYPLFIWISRILVKEMSTHTEKAVSGVRRWLTYFTLFVTASALMGDVITLIFYLLEGELSIRFLLKVFVVLAVAGTVFLYYFLSLRTQPKTTQASGLNKLFLTIATAIVGVAVVWGIVLAGSPGAERERKFDDRRVEDLRAIQNEITNIAYGNKPIRPDAPVVAIPKTLQEISDQAVYQKLNLTDPETGASYIYNVQSATKYQLCATFSFERDLSYDIFWNHPAGEHCFDLDAAETTR
ncbi:DUF5671 domain-containing protein [Candidatus Peribacteria bacterium]|nr:MAG: DUF5671 domain-containing protein [Candidatus Peribacteria bacterium]